MGLGGKKIITITICERFLAGKGQACPLNHRHAGGAARALPPLSSSSLIGFSFRVRLSNPLHAAQLIPHGTCVDFATATEARWGGGGGISHGAGLLCSPARGKQKRALPGRTVAGARRRRKSGATAPRLCKVVLGERSGNAAHALECGA